MTDDDALGLSEEDKALGLSFGRSVATVGESITRFGETRVVVDFDCTGVWFRERGLLGYAPFGPWIKWLAGRR